MAALKAAPSSEVTATAAGSPPASGWHQTARCCLHRLRHGPSLGSGVFWLSISSSSASASKVTAGSSSSAACFPISTTASSPPTAARRDHDLLSGTGGREGAPAEAAAAPLSLRSRSASVPVPAVGPAGGAVEPGTRWAKIRCPWAMAPAQPEAPPSFGVPCTCAGSGAPCSPAWSRDSAAQSARDRTAHCADASSMSLCCSCIRF